MSDQPEALEWPQQFLGRFRGLAKWMGLQPSKQSSAIAASVLFQCGGQKNHGQYKRATDESAEGWTDWSSSPVHNVWGRFWVVGKDGNINIKQLRALLTLFPLDEDGAEYDVNAAPLLAIDEGRVKLGPCQFSVEKNEWKDESGEVRSNLQAVFPERFDYDGGTKARRSSGVSHETLAEIHARYGESLKTKTDEPAKFEEMKRPDDGDAPF